MQAHFGRLQTGFRNDHKKPMSLFFSVIISLWLFYIFNTILCFRFIDCPKNCYEGRHVKKQIEQVNTSEILFYYA